MKIAELKSHIGVFGPALALEILMSREHRWRVERILSILLALFALITAFLLALEFMAERYPDEFVSIVGLIPKIVKRIIYGIAMIVLAAKLFMLALDAFFYSHYFRGTKLFLDDEVENKERRSVSFELASILFETGGDDITRDFFKTRYGARTLMRCGIGSSDVVNFFKERGSRVTADTFEVSSERGVYEIQEYIHALLHYDAEFSHFLSEMQIQEKELVAAARWIVKLERLIMLRKRFWSKDYLGRIPGIGKDWAYGGAYILEKYSYEISSRSNFSSIGILSGYGAKEVEEIEAILARKKEANALLIGDYTAGKLDILSQLARQIMEGTVLPPLEHKRMLILNVDLMIAVKKAKADFESELIRVMNDAESAGNIILVFENLPSFIKSAEAIGSEIVNILDPYLSSQSLQVVALADADSFHRVIEPNTALMQRFEKVTVSATDEDQTIGILEDIVLQYEKNQGVYFTYQAVREIAESADRYFQEGVMPDKAIDLIAEIVPRVMQAGRGVITKDDVLALVKEKTGIAVGEVTPDERDKLLQLEDLLHRRVIGQDEAIKAIANAMRRARSGVGNENRPMGSFLFLGPTGVGKTETTKALSHTFFGDEKAVIRIDMSEYNTSDALEKLIGSYSFGKVGVLSSKIRERPYGVLLLDEFEKTTHEVMDLFLQVLDEGFFSDMAGKRVNCRNLIIIATSNAGSDLIFKLVEQGKNLAENSSSIIGNIINRGIFKPELMNRFDGVIIFHPLTDVHLRKVAKLMLNRLRKRLAEKNIELVINDHMVTYLMKFGVDPKFGGRPMNRAIQEKVEELIARRIIRGEIKPGSKIEFKTEDFI